MSIKANFDNFVSSLESSKGNPPKTVAMRYAKPTEIDKMQEDFNKRWEKRIEIATGFKNNFEKIVENVLVEIPYGGGKPSSLLDLPTLQKTPPPKITEVRQDGGAYAATLENPLVVIAGNSTNIGGSAYRRSERGAGDAQEEKFTETYPIALAIAAKIGAKIEEGELKYPTDASVALEIDRATLRAKGIINVDGKMCDAAICVAPDLKNSKKYENLVKYDTDLKKVITDLNDPRWDSYIEEIYTMYSHLAHALAKSDPQQPIVLTLPGAGVFSNGSEDARLIQGVCLRMAVENNPKLKDKADAGLLRLPFPEKTVMSGYRLDAPKISDIFDKVNTVAQSLGRKSDLRM